MKGRGGTLKNIVFSTPEILALNSGVKVKKKKELIKGKEDGRIKNSFTFLLKRSELFLTASYLHFWFFLLRGSNFSLEPF